MRCTAVTMPGTAATMNPGIRQPGTLRDHPIQGGRSGRRRRTRCLAWPFVGHRREARRAPPERPDGSRSRRRHHRWPVGRDARGVAGGVVSVAGSVGATGPVSEPGGGTGAGVGTLPALVGLEVPGSSTADGVAAATVGGAECGAGEPGDADVGRAVSGTRCAVVVRGPRRCARSSRAISAWCWLGPPLGDHDEDAGHRHRADRQRPRRRSDAQHRPIPIRRSDPPHGPHRSLGRPAHGSTLRPGPGLDMVPTKGSSGLNRRCTRPCPWGIQHFCRESRCVPRCLRPVFTLVSPRLL
jgi:hypothetical protein